MRDLRPRALTGESYYMELIHMTAAYSNAVLVAILPHVSDFAKKLDLPIPQPITATQVLKSRPSPYQGRVEASEKVSKRCQSQLL